MSDPTDMQIEINTERAITVQVTNGISNIWDEYTRICTIGEGQFGKVLLCQKASEPNREKQYALKILSKEKLVREKQQRHAIHEKRLLNTLANNRHPFIVQLRHQNCYMDQSYLYLAMEYVPGGDLFSYLQTEVSLGENEMRFFASQVLLVFEYLHSRAIIYRDLKPENLAINADGYIKVIDFGFAKHVPKESRTNTACGTYEYMAPEILRQELYGKAVDWWAFGILIYEMSHGFPPFFASARESIKDKILMGHFHMPNTFSQNLSDLILTKCKGDPEEPTNFGLLSNDLTLRYGNMVGGTDDVKNHPWFAPMNFDDLYNKRIRPRRTFPEYNPGENFGTFPDEPFEVDVNANFEDFKDF